MIELFKMNRSVEVSEIGRFPQVEQRWIDPVDYWAPNSFAMTPLQGSINFDIIFPVFEAAQSAKLTDWVSTVNIDRNYLMVTTRFYRLLQSFKMDEYQHFPTQIRTHEGILNYNLIYFPWPRGDDFIDWERSTFHRITANGDCILMQFKNVKERQLAIDSHEIRIEKLLIHTEKITMDIFRFKGFEDGYYVTRRLKDSIETNGMTGIRFEKAKWMDK